MQKIEWKELKITHVFFLSKARTNKERQKCKYYGLKLKKKAFSILYYIYLRNQRKFEFLFHSYLNTLLYYLFFIYCLINLGYYKKKNMYLVFLVLKNNLP
jgi:hypothetical protein